MGLLQRCKRMVQLRRGTDNECKVCEDLAEDERFVGSTHTWSLKRSLQRNVPALKNGQMRENMRSLSPYLGQGHGAGPRNGRLLRKPKLKRKSTRPLGEWHNITCVQPVVMNSHPLMFRWITLNPLSEMLDLQPGMITYSRCSVIKKIYRYCARLVTHWKQN